MVCSRCTEQEPSCGLTSWLRLPEKPRGVSAAAPAALSKVLNVQDVRLQYPTEHLHTVFSAWLPLYGDPSASHIEASLLCNTCAISDRPVRKPPSHGCLSWAFIVGGVGPQSSLNIAKRSCLCFG